MKKWFKSIFSYNSSEEKGRFALLFLFWVIFTAVLLKQYWYPYFNDTLDNTELSLTYIDTLVIADVDTLSVDKFDSKLSNLKPFDPNAVDSVFLKHINLKSYAINNWLKFLNAGGSFKNPEDLKKIYGLSDENYSELKPFIRIHTVDKSNTKKDVPERQKDEYSPPLHVNINTADSAMFTQIRGIGPVFASRIVKYRESLGGFIHTDQLYEVYGMDSAVVIDNADLWSIDTPVIQQLNINSSEFKVLLKHPYVSYKQAQAIFNYKKQHGDFSDKSDLLNVVVLDSTWYNKIQAYLTVK